MGWLPASNHHDVVIIDAGFGGIGAAIQLGRHGFGAQFEAEVRALDRPFGRHHGER